MAGTFRPLARALVPTSFQLVYQFDFVEAQRMWEDPDRLEVPARTEDEPRWLLIARTGEKVWSAVFTHRGDDIRIISVRRARDVEVKLYES